MALLTSVAKNWQTLLEFARTLPPEDEAITATRTLPPEDEAITAATVDTSAIATRTTPPSDGTTATMAADADSTTSRTTIAAPPPRRLRQHHTRLTPLQKDEVIALYQQGVPVGQICQRYGISKQQVSDLRAARGIPRRPRGLTDEQKRQAEQHYLAGQSCATIGRQFGVHAETVRRHLRTTGVALRPRPGAA